MNYRWRYISYDVALSLHYLRVIIIILYILPVILTTFLEQRKKTTGKTKTQLSFTRSLGYAYT